jgi:hypothetical protein
METVSIVDPMWGARRLDNIIDVSYRLGFVWYRAVRGPFDKEGALQYCLGPAPLSDLIMLKENAEKVLAEMRRLEKQAGIDRG